MSDIFAKSKVDISSLLPADYKRKIEGVSKLQSSTVRTTTPATTAKSSTSSGKVALPIQDLFASSKVDISALLPKDYVERKQEPASDGKAGTDNIDNERNATVTERTDSPTTKKSSLKIVFPSRPGGRKPIYKITTSQTPRGDGPGAVTPKIQKGWPTR